MWKQHWFAGVTWNAFCAKSIPNRSTTSTVKQSAFKSEDCISVPILALG